MYSDEIEDYVRAAYAYYVLDEPIMSDYEWDMLAKRIQDNWDDYKSPYKKYLEKDTVAPSAHHLDWDAMINEGLLPRKDTNDDAS